MGSNEDERLDRAYITIDHFLNGIYTRSEDINQARLVNEVEFHFNKPGFDLALIITHTSLISKISKIQIPLQSKYGFTTHVIYLPNISRLKFCIRDLKLHEILYALIINENSETDDEYDVFILSDIIEHQKKMQYDEAIELICDDWTNYTDQLRRLMNNPSRCPHVDNDDTEGFISPSSNVRYLLCLLGDYRKLELKELLILRAFLKSRKDAIIAMGGRPVNYGFNDRPIPSFKQENFKYYIYDHMSNTNAHNEIIQKTHHNDVVVTYKPGNHSHPTYAQKSINLTDTVYTESPVNNTYSSNDIIMSSPKLYNPNNSKNICQPPRKVAPVQSKDNINLPNNSAVKNTFIKSSKSNNQKNNIPSASSKQVAQPLPIKNVPQPIKSGVVSNNDSVQVLKESCQKETSKSNVNVQNVEENKDKTYKDSVESRGVSKTNIPSRINSCDSSDDPVIMDVKEEPIDNSDAQSFVYQRSPASSISSEKSSWQDPTVQCLLYPVSTASSDRLLKRDIDLREVNGQSSNLLTKKTRPNSSLQVTDLTLEYSPTKSKVTKVSCNVLMNLFKFVLNMSPLALPSHSEVLQLLKTCLMDMEKYVSDSGLSKIVVDMRACRSGGCQDIIRIIETLSGEKVSGTCNVIPDLNYMWLYFPRNLSPDNVNIMFYKVVKMIELTMSSKTSSDLLITMIQKLGSLVNYNFKLSEHNSFNNLNCFPSLFKEYFNLSTELHNLNVALPPPEPASASFKADLDKAFIEFKIKFMLGPLMEYFVKVINSIHYQLDIQTMEDVFVAFRTLRFCLRKICSRLLPDHLPQFVPFSINDDIMARTMELLDEVNFIIREVSLMNCILFTKKHYDFINLILDFAIKIEKSVTEGTEADTCPMDLECLIDLDPIKFLNDYSTNIKTAIYPYHHDTEIEVLKKSLKNRWIEILQQAFIGISPEPDGSRISKEILYLLPKGWGKHTFDEAVTEAANLSYIDWESMLDNDFTRARLIYSDVRNNYLMWLSNNNLEHKKAMELMTVSQKKLDSKIMTKQS